MAFKAQKIEMIYQEIFRNLSNLSLKINLRLFFSVCLGILHQLPTLSKKSFDRKLY